MSKEKKVESSAFKCPSCGADMRFDPESGHLKCDFCGREEAIEANREDIEEYDFEKAETDETLNDWGTQTKTVQCENCGGTTIVPAEQTTVTCAFCGSPKVVSRDELPGIKPESVIPFKIGAKESHDLFIKWIKKRKLAPSKLKKEYKADNVKGVYIPYWSYDTNTMSTYSGQAGDYYYAPETYTSTSNGRTETQSRQVQKIRWRFVAGTYDKAFDDIIFNDSGTLDQKMIERIEPYQLNELLHYNPRFLVGFAAERYKTGLKAVWERAKKFIANVLMTDIKAIIKRSCDVVGNVNVHTTYKDIKYKHMLLPVWISSYRFKKKVYNFYINGQTGEVQGKAPKSIVKIGAIVLLIVAICVALYFIFR